MSRIERIAGRVFLGSILITNIGIIFGLAFLAFSSWRLSDAVGVAISIWGCFILLITLVMFVPILLRSDDI